MHRIARKALMNSTLQTKRYLADWTKLSKLVDIQPEIYAALRDKQPVVALESTIITHGMPYPSNLETAIAVEEVIRAERAIPATIAIMDGRIKVGLTQGEIETLARSSDGDGVRTVKVSRRDLAFCLSKKWNGGTTVAGTLIIANMVGIKIFATGGIGGVHRDGENTMDVSADLIELGRCPVAVVSAGVKSILDIPRTLEFLETQGVTVASYQSPSGEFPAFYTRTSGSKVPYNLANAEEAAALLASSKELNLKSGVLIGVPVPEQFAMDQAKIKGAIDAALTAASQKGITGKEVTPFVLAAVSKITEGQSLQTNIALIKNNARVAAQIAVALSNFDKLQPAQPNHINAGAMTVENVPVVVGGSVVDTCITVESEDLKLDGATYNSHVEISCGGVGRNIAEGIYKMYGASFLISAVGADLNGRFLQTSFPPGSCIRTTDKSATGNFAVILSSNGDCKLIAGDMNVHREISPDLILQNEDRISRCPMVVMDTNIPIESMETLLTLCLKHKRPVFFEPTDLKFAGKPFKLPEELHSAIRYISPNIEELRTIVTQLGLVEPGRFDASDLSTFTESEVLEHTKELATMMTTKVEKCIVTLGSLGALISTGSTGTHHFYLTTPVKELVNVSGAGDSFVSGFITALLKGYPEDVCVAMGFKAAHRALRSKSAVPTKYFDSFDEAALGCEQRKPLKSI